MWIPLMILIFILASQASAQKQRQRSAYHRPPSAPTPPEYASDPSADEQLRRDASETQTPQQRFMAAHAREEASMCDPTQGHAEMHAPAVSTYAPVQTPEPYSAAPVHPLSHLLNAQNLQNAVILAEIFGPPGGKGFTQRRPRA